MRGGKDDVTLMLKRINVTHGLRLMSSLKFSGALFLFLLSASHLSLVHVI